MKYVNRNETNMIQESAKNLAAPNEDRTRDPSLMRAMQLPAVLPRR
jgi:predicted P-loop ATPase/GTPase